MIVLIIAVVILVVICFLFFRNRKKKMQIILFISAICILIVGVSLYNIVFYNYSDKVTIKTAADTDFSINIQNHPLRYEYHYAQFSSQLSEDELMNELSSQYENVFYDNELEQIGFVFDNQIYTIECYDNSSFLWTDRNKYTLRNNTIGIVIEGKNYDIPIPVKAIHNDVEVYSEEMRLKCNYETFMTYYKDFNNAEFLDDCVLLTYADYKVALTISKENVLNIAKTNN